MIKVSVFLFDNFEYADICHPLEMMKDFPDLFKVTYYSPNGGLVSSRMGVCFDTEAYPVLIKRKLTEESNLQTLLLLPGYRGSNLGLFTPAFIKQIKTIVSLSTWTITTGIGSAIIAMTGILVGRPAVTSITAFSKYPGLEELAVWNKNITWCQSGGIFTGTDEYASREIISFFIAKKCGFTSEECECLSSEDPIDAEELRKIISENLQISRTTAQ